MKSQFYIGLAAKQDGDNGKAAKLWQQLLDRAPGDAAWVPAVRQALAKLPGHETAKETARADANAGEAPIAGGPVPGERDIAARPVDQFSPEYTGRKRQIPMAAARTRSG